MNEIHSKSAATVTTAAAADAAADKIQITLIDTNELYIPCHATPYDVYDIVT